MAPGIQLMEKGKIMWTWEVRGTMKGIGDGNGNGDIRGGVIIYTNDAAEFQSRQIGEGSEHVRFIHGPIAYSPQ